MLSRTHVRAPPRTGAPTTGCWSSEDGRAMTELDDRIGTGLDDLRERIAGVRAELRRSAGIEEGAWGVDGHTFAFEVALSRPLPVGGYALLTTRDGRRYVGQITNQRITARPGPQVSVDLASALGGDGMVGTASTTVNIRLAAGDGVLLAAVSDDGFAALDRHATFDLASLEEAPGDLVDAYIDWSRKGVGLATGAAMYGSGDVLPLLSAKGFNRHTFLCGQSGSGKTYGLGVLLERLLLETTIEMFILDPNSDYVGIGDLLPADQSGAKGYLYDRVAAHWERLRDRIVVVGPGEGAMPLRVVFGRLTLDQQALVLGLDPLADPERFGAFRELRAAYEPSRLTLDRLIADAEAADDPRMHALALHIRNMGATDWDVWVGEDDTPLLEALPDDRRVLIIDLGRTDSASERAVLSTAALEWLWRWRHDRVPRLVVIDEAHNVCPQVPRDRIQELATEHVIRIAAEGRKYGLYLLLSTQQPQKIHANVLAQCDNLILLRMNSRVDTEHLARVFGFVPPSLIHQASSFTLGEGLVAGRIASHAMLYRGDRRWTREGGADVPTTWASPPA
jgi:hypothetical protein